MTLSKLTEDLNKVQALADQPNANGGLTAAQVKAVFDDAGNAIKDFINDTLTEEIADQFATQTQLADVVLGDIPDGSLTYAKLTPAPVSTATANALTKRDANGRTQFADPSAAADAATKGYVDTTAAAARPYVSGTYTGDGTASRNISLAFTPSAVLVVAKNGEIRSSGGTMFGGLAVTGSDVNSGTQSALAVATNAFTVIMNGTASTNQNTVVYHYIAFK